MIKRKTLKGKGPSLPSLRVALLNSKGQAVRSSQVPRAAGQEKEGPGTHLSVVVSVLSRSPVLTHGLSRARREPEGQTWPGQGAGRGREGPRAARQHRTEQTTGREADEAAAALSAPLSVSLSALPVLRHPSSPPSPRGPAPPPGLRPYRPSPLRHSLQRPPAASSSSSSSSSPPAR